MRSTLPGLRALRYTISKLVIVALLTLKRPGVLAFVILDYRMQLTSEKAVHLEVRPQMHLAQVLQVFPTLLRN